MKILKANFETTDIGLSSKTSNLSLFFGNKNSSVDAIQKKFPELRPQRIRQTHSDTVIQASNQIHEADAHFSADQKMALLISTADCLPVLIYCSETKRVAAAHAGWKGVANQIVLKTLRKLAETGSVEKKFELWIGPHILQGSFEIDFDVLKQLQTSSYNLSQEQYSYEKDSKYYVDLNQIVFSQIAQVAHPDSVVNCIEVDTKTDLNFWSFRRDKDKAGRNLSFISIS